MSALYDMKRHKTLETFSNYKNDNYLIEPVLMTNKDDLIDKFVIGGEDGTVTMINFDNTV